jgi:MazG family protein
MDSINKLLEIMAALRDGESGCPWDVRQDFASIAPYTVEEAYEVADAIDRQDLPGLKDELGDLLFQVAFHAQMASEQGAFDFDMVAAGICEKMIRRHPHVFGSEEEKAAGHTRGAWEQIKAAERAAGRDETGGSALDGVALAIPALKRAEKLGKRASRVGFDWPDSSGPRNKIGEEMTELSAAECSGGQERLTEELGDVLFSVVNLARHLGVDPEQALGVANRKFEKRFRHVETLAAASGKALEQLDSDALETLWQAAKKA